MRYQFWVVLLAAVACGGGEKATGAAASKPAVSAQLVSAPIADTIQSTVAIDILALDAEQKAATGQVVNFVVTGGGGSIFAPAVTTDGAGHARNSWTLGPFAGAQVVELRTISATGAPVVLGTARAEVKPGEPVSFALFAGEASDPAAAWIVGRARDVSELLSLPITDRRGNTVTAYTVTAAQAGTWVMSGSTFTAPRPWESNQITITLGKVAKAFTAWAIEDWRNTRWTATYACAPKGSNSYTRYVVAVDSVRYRGESSLWIGPQTLGVVFTSGTATAPGGAQTALRREMVLWRVWQDSMQVGVPAGAPNGDGRIYTGSTSFPGYQISTGTFMRSSAGASTFVARGTGMSWCLPTEDTEPKVQETGNTFVLTRLP